MKQVNKSLLQLLALKIMPVDVDALKKKKNPQFFFLTLKEKLVRKNFVDLVVALL